MSNQPFTSERGRSWMSPEVAEAIRIADQHLAGEPIPRREALAKDIIAAICKHAHSIAADAISEAFRQSKSQH